MNHRYKAVSYTHLDVYKRQGMDFSAPLGTDVYATGDGTVIQMGWQTGYGNRIVVDHGFGYQTVYALSLIHIFLRRWNRIWNDLMC